MMDQYWHKGGICGIISRATLRTLQFISAITIMGIYGPDLTHSTRTHTTANSEWIFAEVAACLSALTCMTHCFVTVTRVAWCLWDWVLCVLWMAQVGVFGSIYLKGGKKEQYVGATTSEARMRAGVGVGLVNLVLWFATAVLGIAWCCRARRFTRKGKAVKAGVADEEEAAGKMLVDDDVEKGADQVAGSSDVAILGSRTDDKKAVIMGDGSSDLERKESKESLTKPPSYKSV
ncbi:hypothetical protein DL95DRAFT_452914 [Leptodontidium sp. 2 PMI_412]|nr:hypothetical protein DL95DRAFT_452914 [Leptodontidium sp. 2 PMI_412]